MIPKLGLGAIRGILIIIWSVAKFLSGNIHTQPFVCVFVHENITCNIDNKNQTSVVSVLENKLFRTYIHQTLIFPWMISRYHNPFLMQYYYNWQQATASHLTHCIIIHWISNLQNILLRLFSCNVDLLLTLLIKSINVERRYSMEEE